MYISRICGVDTLADELLDINELGEEIISTFFTSDTFQVVLICKVREEEAPKVNKLQEIMGRVREA